MKFYSPNRKICLSSFHFSTEEMSWSLNGTSEHIHTCSEVVVEQDSIISKVFKSKHVFFLDLP